MVHGAIGLWRARVPPHSVLIWRTLPSAEAANHLPSAVSSLPPHTHRTCTLLSCASFASPRGRNERRGRVERLQAPPARAGSTLRAARHPGMSRAYRCFSAAARRPRVAGSIWCAASRRAVVALSWRGARASVPEAHPRRCAPQASGSHRSASSRRRRRRPPPTSVARRPSTPPGRCSHRRDRRPPLPPRATAIARRRRRRHSPTAPSLADAADAVITACESQLGVSLCENKISLVPSCPASRPRAAAGARAAASGGPGRRRVSRHRERQRKYKYDCN